jgi:hypothetical protein
MKIRATTKLLNISGIKPIKDESPATETLPGEWYAAAVSLLRPGKLAVHFLHYPTYISILIPGKSLNKLIPLLQDHVSAFLKRQGYSRLEPDFQLNSDIEIFATNSRSMLAHMNQIKYNLEYHFSDAQSVDEIDYAYLEDIHFDYLFGGKNKVTEYIKPKDVLDKFLIESNLNKK